MTAILSDLLPHPMRSLLPALAVLTRMGFTAQDCLRGTGILHEELKDGSARLTLQQELAFYRNALDLSRDPTIGLRLGEPYVPQRYGLFGYALLSAPTFRHALTLTEHFGCLTFSFFTLRFGVSGTTAWFSFSEPPPIEAALIDLYLDRDMSAAVVDFSEMMGEHFTLSEVFLSHDGHGQKALYRDYFAADVHFGAQEGRFVFSAELLDLPLVQSDPEASRHFQQQCQMLIAKLTDQGSLIDDVRMMILARPGYYPDIDFVAEKLGMSSRTLRRRLNAENSSYRQILDEIRFGLAREYLDGTSLSMEQIGGLLGYTEAANFSHAFRRWSGCAPRQWRERGGQKTLA